MTPLRDAESATAGVPVELREAAEKATAGEWRVFDAGELGVGVTGIEAAADIAHVHGLDSRRTREQELANAAYIVAAQPRNVIALLSELDTARAEIERLGFELGAAKKIIAACAGALPNGAFIDPERASMDFMEMLPDEIHAVCAGMSDEIAKLQQDRRKVHELSATLRDKSTWNLPIQEAAQEIVLLSSQLPDPNAEPTNATLSPVKEPK